MLQTARAVAAAIDAGKPVPFSEMNRAAAAASVDEKNAAVALLVDGIERAPPMVAALRAIASGGLVENGADPTLGADAVVDALCAVCARIAAAMPADPAGIDLDRGTGGGDDVRAFPLLVVGAMARLARDVALRKRFRAHPSAAAIRAIDEATGANHAHYLASVLDMLDDEPLLVVELGGPDPKVRRVRAFGVRNGFHLITLLENKDPRALVAQGATSVTSSFGWFTWPAIEKVRQRFIAKELGASLWGEMFARDLPQFDGVRVAVRAPPVLASRSWSIGFVAPIHDALVERVVDEGALAVADARALLDRMIAARA